MKADRFFLLFTLSGALALPVLAQPVSNYGPANPVTNGVTFSPGWSLVANPLFHYRGTIAATVTPDNSVSAVFPRMPNHTVLLKFDNATHRFLRENVFRGNHWSNPQETLAPGEGAFLFNPKRKPLAISFTGNWWYGPIAIPAGLSLISSPGPGLINFAPLLTLSAVGDLPRLTATGQLVSATTDSPILLPIPPALAGINFNPQEGDVVYTFDGRFGEFVRHRFHNGAWDSLPQVREGESCFVLTRHSRVIQYSGPLPVNPD